MKGAYYRLVDDCQGIRANSHGPVAFRMALDTVSTHYWHYTFAAVFLLCSVMPRSIAGKCGCLTLSVILLTRNYGIDETIFTNNKLYLYIISE